MPLAAAYEQRMGGEPEGLFRTLSHSALGTQPRMAVHLHRGV